MQKLAALRLEAFGSDTARDGRPLRSSFPVAVGGRPFWVKLGGHAAPGRAAKPWRSKITELFG